MMDFKNQKSNKGFHRPEFSRPAPAQEQRRQEYHAPVEETVDMEKVLKRVSLFFGFALLIISIFFSYDGFDQKVTGGNTNYSLVAKGIGILMAAVVTVVEFIFNTDHKHLNGTLIVAGLVAYAYSIWTNYLGISHTLQADQITAGIMAVFMDVLPETMISWALNSSLKGDLIGNTVNVLKSVFGMKPSHSNRQSRNYQVQDDFKNRIGK